MRNSIHWSGVRVRGLLAAVGAAALVAIAGCDEEPPPAPSPPDVPTLEMTSPDLP